MMTRPFQSLINVEKTDIQLWIILALNVPVLLWMLNRLERFLAMIWQDKLLLFLLGLALLSILWSVARDHTLSAYVILLGGTLFGVFLAMRYSLHEQMYIFAWVFGLIVILDLFVILFFPELGAYKGGLEGAWAGIYNHKNALGRYMAIAAILFWILMSNSRVKWAMMVGFILSVGLLVGSRSATSLLAVIIVLGLLPLYRQMRSRDVRQSRVVVSIVIIITCAAALLFARYLDFDTISDSFFSALGRNPNRNTMQIREILWTLVWERVQDHPFLGYGYGNALANDPNVAYELNPFGTIWQPEQAHNGYLETLIELGLVGLLAIMLYFVSGFRRGIVLSYLTKSSEGLWILAYLTLLLLFNLTYSLLTGQITVPWTIFVALMLSARVEIYQIKSSH